MTTQARFLKNALRAAGIRQGSRNSVPSVRTAKDRRTGEFGRASAHISRLLTADETASLKAASRWVEVRPFDHFGHQFTIVEY